MEGYTRQVDMTSTPEREPTLSDIAQQIRELRTELDDVKRFQQQGQQWQDRTWDVVKWVGGISAGLAISASIALVGIVIRQLGQ
jgi:hypothetical protein